MTIPQVIRKLRELRQVARTVERECEQLIEGLESSPQNDTGMIDQHESALGPRRHCAAVRRRRSEGKLDAFIFGRRHVLTAEAYAEERTWAGRSEAQLANCGARSSADAEEEIAYRALLKRMGN